MTSSPQKNSSSSPESNSVVTHSNSAQQSSEESAEHSNNSQLIDQVMSETEVVAATTNQESPPNAATPAANNTTGPIRVPGTYPPEWLPDHETEACMACQSLFTLIKRRHHCRACGKIFCGECCKQKAKLLYLDNKEARVCSGCFCLIQYTLTATNSDENNSRANSFGQNHETTNSSVAQSRLLNASSSSTASSSSSPSQSKVQGVLKTSNQSSANECNTSTSIPNDQQQQQQSTSNKQVTFADGIRPGTDLSESFPYPTPSSSTSISSRSTAAFSLLTRQSKSIDVNHSGSGSSVKKNRKPHENSYKNITVCDELGYLPPIVISEETNQLIQSTSDNTNSNSLTSIIANQFRLTNKKSLQASMESRSCPLNGIIKFEEISSLVGVEEVITFLLLKDFYLKVKLISKQCCLNKHQVQDRTEAKLDNNEEFDKETLDDTYNNDTLISLKEETDAVENNNVVKYWCFTSEGLSRYGQNEIVLVIDKDKDDSCIPRDIFKIYLTLHELALRRQPLENLGNLLFQDGLFGNRDTAGLLFVRPLEDHCLKNIVLPSNKTYLFALVLQRWEVPWSKVFPMRLLLRLGHKFDVYPYPIVSFSAREPVYYEVGHTVISILGDFRNFRYSLTHVDGLKVMLNKKTRKILVQLNQSCYQQFNKVLDSSNNEHVLAWSSCPFSEARGHLVSVQNEEGQYETVEFYKKRSDHSVSFEDLDESSSVLGASFIIFSGALKVNQGGQSAKISIVEDGLLIQIQSCTMSALKNAIHFMHHFDINCDSNHDQFDRVEIDWQLDQLEDQVEC